MDYATYIRVKSEMTAQRSLMEQRAFPSETNGWLVGPGVLRGFVGEIRDFLLAPKHREPASNTSATRDKKLRTAASR